MRKYWNSDYTNDTTFWEHEWKKHGSCMFLEMSEHEYFSKTLELYDEAVKEGIIKKECIYNYNTDCHLNLDLNFHFYEPYNMFIIDDHYGIYSR